jgi:hypothetical protein
MAVYNNLAGAGAQGLTPGTNRLFVDVLSYGPGYSTGEAAPQNYYHLGLLRLGVQGAYYPAIPVDGASIVVDLPVGVTTLGYSLKSGTSIKVTEATVVPPNDALQPWDRNPAFVTQGTIYSVNGGASTSSAWTYTVPSGRILAVTHAIVEISRYETPSQPNYAQGVITINGVLFLIAMLGEFESVPSVADQLSGGTLFLPAATVFLATYQNTAVGGSVFVQAMMNGYLFDA